MNEPSSRSNGGARLSGTTLNSPDPQALASFYAQLLGWEVVTDEPDWVTLPNPEGGPGLSFQAEPAYVRPVWPAAAGNQQMMLHLEIQVEDLELASAHARACGAVEADFQPQDDVRVHLDPDGHPFCLFTA